MNMDGDNTNGIQLNLVETEELMDGPTESAEALDLGVSYMRSVFKQVVNAKFYDIFKKNERTINVTKAERGFVTLIKQEKRILY